MLARLYVSLPFSLVLPDGENYLIYLYEDSGYEIRLFPPVKSENPSPDFVDGEKLTINDKPAFRANTLRFDFVKETFDRRSGIECDPPYELINRTINFFIRKLRFVVRGFPIKEIDFPRVSWRLQYFNDDETEVEKEEGMVKGRGGIAFQFGIIPLSPEIWNNIHSLPSDYVPPKWDSLYLDALAELPDIGPAIVLAETSLEVFIAYLLDMLAKKTTIPTKLWHWINNRSDWLKDPSTAEQYDDLLQILLGISLKVDNPTLWQAFKNIKNARNSFVHEGIAKIGKKPITNDEGKRLVHSAAEIINFIKTKLPNELRWPEFEHNTSVSMERIVLGEQKSLD